MLSSKIHLYLGNFHYEQEVQGKGKGKVEMKGKRSAEEFLEDLKKQVYGVPEGTEWQYHERLDYEVWDLLIELGYGEAALWLGKQGFRYE